MNTGKNFRLNKKKLKGESFYGKAVKRFGY